MDTAVGHGDGGATEDEDNGEEMSDLSSVCSCDDPPRQRLAATATAKCVFLPPRPPFTQTLGTPRRAEMDRNTDTQTQMRPR